MHNGRENPKGNRKVQEKSIWIAWLSQEIHCLSTSIHKVIHINHRRLGKSQRKTFAFWRIKRRKNGRFIAESSALVGRVCQPKNEIPCSRSGKFRKCVGRIQFQTSNKFCPMKRMIGRVSSEMFIESSTEETKCRSLCMEGSGRGEEEISPRHPPVRHH